MLNRVPSDCRVAESELRNRSNECTRSCVGLATVKQIAESDARSSWVRSLQFDRPLAEGLPLGERRLGGPRLPRGLLGILSAHGSQASVVADAQNTREAARPA